MPHPRGLDFVLRFKVYANHAADTVNIISRTGFLIHLNYAIVYWFYNKHNNMESIIFGSEFVAMKHCCEYLQRI